MQFTEADASKQPSNHSCIDVVLESPLAAGKTLDLSKYTVHTDLLTPYPKQASQSDPQRVLLSGNAYASSPYPISSQTTKVSIPTISCRHQTDPVDCMENTPKHAQHIWTVTLYTSCVILACIPSPVPHWSYCTCVILMSTRIPHMARKSSLSYSLHMHPLCHIRVHVQYLCHPCAHTIPFIRSVVQKLVLEGRLVCADAGSTGQTLPGLAPLRLWASCYQAACLPCFLASLQLPWEHHLGPGSWDLGPQLGSCLPLSWAFRQLFCKSQYFLQKLTTPMQVKLTSSTILSLTGLAPTKRAGKVLTFGPYQDLAASAAAPFTAHFENNHAFPRVTQLTRELEVSHWGNVYVEEKYYIRNAAAQHKVCMLS